MSDGIPTDKVVIIGARLSGISMAVQLKRLLKHDNFQIYDKLDDIGGTWAQNTYPNLSCDVPSEFYSCSFFQDPDWSEKFASQQEILEYIHSCARHFYLEPHLNLQQECISVRWSEDNALWTLSFRDIVHNKLYEVKARYIVTAMGVLNIPQGLDNLSLFNDFGGQSFHTSEWRDIDLDGKRVMVIGNGCSANQVIPWILNERKPKTLVQIVRTSNWLISNRFLRYIPFVMQLRQLCTAYSLDKTFAAFYNNKASAKARKAAEGSIRSYMKSESNPKYHQILLPRYDLGAKRTVMDHGYLAATKRDEFTLIKCDGLRSVGGSDRRTLVVQAGDSHEIDIVIIANGFKTQDLLTPMKVFGKNRKGLGETWRGKGGSEAYMGCR